MGKHRLRKWLGACRHQAIVWINVDLSSKVLSDIHLKAISQEEFVNLIRYMCSESTLTKVLLHVPESNELKMCFLIWANALEPVSPKSYIAFVCERDILDIDQIIKPNINQFINRSITCDWRTVNFTYHYCNSLYNFFSFPDAYAFYANFNCNATYICDCSTHFVRNPTDI